MNIPVVYEDDWLCVVDKPAGLLVVPTPKNERRTLTNILNDDLRKRGLSYNFHPCHRLDRETSGLIIFAKGKSIQKKMMDEFRRKEVKKTYIAFVQGLHSRSFGEVKIPIEGQTAITKYRVLEKKKNFSIVEVLPLTGRTNHIRIHFKQIGHPLVGETKFAFRRDFALRAKRLSLHAKELEFTHPLSKKNIHLSSELAKDLKEFLEKNA